MLTIKCAACKRKLWKYDKIGHGDLLRCYKSRMGRIYDYERRAHKLFCACGKPIGIDKGTFIKMIKNAFVHSGTKRN